jgi:hypothetical protein
MIWIFALVHLFGMTEPAVSGKFPVTAGNDPFSASVEGCTQSRIIGPDDREDDKATVQFCSVKIKKGATPHNATVRFLHRYRGYDWINYGRVTGLGGKSYETDVHQNVVTCHGDTLDRCLYSEMMHIKISASDFKNCQVAGLALKAYGGFGKTLEFSAAECQALAEWMKMAAPQK